MMDLPSFDLSGKAAVVTGATKGLGYAISLALAAAGADIAVVSRTPADCDKVAAEIAALGRRAVSVPADVTDGESVGRLADAVLAAFGKVDILVNNAGTAVTKKAEELTVQEWDRVVDTNLRAVFLLSQAIGRHMIARETGAIINIASVLGMVGEKGVLPYLASKGGVLQLTRGLALEWARHNIRVNAVAPGYVVTPLNEKELSDEKVRARLIGKIPLRRFGTATEIAGAVVFLAADAASYVTGAVIPVDGGWLAQ
jgi:NAD(P)-dependent dehydrogenase (short-subunit alcohol dehydrogenase family)